GAGRPALRRHPGRGRPGARRAGRGVPRHRRRRGAQGDRPLRDLAGHRRGHDGRTARVDEVRRRLPDRRGKLDGVTPFDFATAGRVAVGAGRAQELARVLPELGSRALVCTGAHPQRHARLLESLAVPHVVSTVDGEPTVATARAVTASAREFTADVVVAIGGGSVLDLGKAVAVLLANGGDPLDYLEVVGRGQPFARPAVPCVAVPTTAGTGSEVTANAVLASPEHGVKASLRSP